MVRCFFYNTFKVKFVGISNYIQYCIIPHAQDTNAFRPNVIGRLVVTSTQQSAFPNTNHSQVQLKTPITIFSTNYYVNRNPQRHYLQHKLAPRSTENPTVTICSTTYHQGQPKTQQSLSVAQPTTKVNLKLHSHSP
jgi:hypothetical protein